ncbi:MAG: flagellar biosynthetic protein FliO [Planctomycetes bacterium]|nr:flagellar biosynthetic protein FliO [Planctomycetota bacterium]
MKTSDGRPLLLAAAAVFCCRLLLAGEAPRTELTFDTPPPPPPPPPGAPAEPAAGTAEDGPAPAEVTTGARLIEEIVAGGLERGATAEESSTPPVAAEETPAASEENQPLFPGAGTRQHSPESPAEPLPSLSPGKMFLRLIAGMAVIAAVIGGGYYFLKKYRGFGIAAGSGKGLLEVIARTQVEPGRSIVMIKAGRRIIIAGSTPQGLSRLGEISDKEEVEALIRQAGQGVPEKAFPVELKLAEKDFEQLDESV